MKLTRKAFCKESPSYLNMIRRKDPILFCVLFNEWERKKQKHI